VDVKHIGSHKTTLLFLKLNLALKRLTKQKTQRHGNTEKHGAISEFGVHKLVAG
jgi:hypothetical protein